MDILANPVCSRAPHHQLGLVGNFQQTFMLDASLQIHKLVGVHALPGPAPTRLANGLHIQALIRMVMYARTSIVQLTFANPVAGPRMALVAISLGKTTHLSVRMELPIPIRLVGLYSL